MTKILEVSGQTYRDAMAHFAGHVHVATTDGKAGKRGTTVIAACSVSDDPPMVLVCLNRHNPANEVFSENGVFALNTLAMEHEAMAAAFAGLTGLAQEDRFAMGQWTTISTGSPVLAGAMASFDCEIVDARDLATHRVLFGKVTGLALADSLKPLIYFNRAWRTL